MWICETEKGVFRILLNRQNQQILEPTYPFKIWQGEFAVKPLSLLVFLCIWFVPNLSLSQETYIVDNFSRR
jgi:hypothetical protein